MGINICIGENSVKKDQWSNFILTHPHGNIFQTPEMFEVYVKNCVYEPLILFALDEDGFITGMLQAIIQREHKGILSIFSSRSIIWGGPLIKNDDADILRLLIQKYNEIIRKKAIYTQFRNIFDNRRNLKVFNSLGYDLMDHLDIILDLKKGEERLWMEIHKNRRKEIMKGIKKGLVVKLIDIHDNNSLESIYHIIYILYKRIGLPLPSFSFFQNAVNILQPTGFLKTFIAYVENEIVGFRMVLTYNSTIYDWYAASNSEFLTYRPNDVLPWEILKWGCNNKFSIFDFGGAGKHGISYGVRNYKERFGGTIVNYGRYQQVHQRLLMNFSKNLFHIYKLYKSRI